MFGGGYITSGYRATLVVLAALVFSTSLAVGSASGATRDRTPPTIKGVSPAGNATGVAVTANVQVNFSEAMLRKSVNTNTVQLFRSDVRVATAVRCGSPCRTAIIDPQQNLEPGTVYRAVVLGGRKGPKDLAGNGLSSGKSWSFSTALDAATGADSTKPTVTLTRPARGATYALNQDVRADYSCGDEASGSGIKSCVGTVADDSPIDTASAGQKTFTVVATDNAGNETSVTHAYTVSECTVLGTAERDVLAGTNGADIICGFGGNDTIKALGGEDILRGGEGYDTASFETSPQRVEASLVTGVADGEGHDELVEIERLMGSLHNDTLIGSDKYSSLMGNAGNDTLRGQGGGDVISGWTGDDVIYGGPGKDSVRGGSGADTLLGEDGDDDLHSQDGVDRNDSLDGGAGADTKVTDAAEASVVNFP